MPHSIPQNLNQTIKKHFLASILFVCSAILFPHLVQAQNEGQAGAGLAIGNPTGVVGKYWLSSTQALQAGVAWDFDDAGDKVELHLDYLMARGNDGMDQAAEGSYWFAYWGVGAKVNVQENDPEFIARFPIGSEYILDKGPFGFFAEVVPGVRFVPDTRFKLSASAGVRFYFIKGGK